MKRINRTEEFNKRVKGEVLNKPHHIEAILEINRQMAKVRREFVIKNNGN